MRTVSTKTNHKEDGKITYEKKSNKIGLFWKPKKSFEGEGLK